MKQPRPKLTFANVVACLALFVALGGGAVAASNLGKNTVGPKQLKKNAVTTPKVKNKAITGAKIKPGTVTGTQIDASTLGTVPVATLANSIAPPEAWHSVGAAGEPGFQNGWKNAHGDPPFLPETVGFFKDREGVVHLKGIAEEGSGEVFQLPPGYRPATNRVLRISAWCGSCGGNNSILVYGSGPEPPGGNVLADGGADAVSLDGVSFRGES